MVFRDPPGELHIKTRFLGEAGGGNKCTVLRPFSCPLFDEDIFHTFVYSASVLR